MATIQDRKNAVTFSFVPVGAGSSGGNEDSRLREQVDDLCTALFDRWCERRELTPLIYLLHAWPFFPSTPHPVKTVSAALRELLKFHMEALDDADRELIAKVNALAGD